MRIYRVTSVVVVRSENRLIVQAAGLAASPGWTNANLKADDPNPEDRVLEFALDATPPTGITLPVLTPISASIVVDGSEVDGVIVKSRTNSIEVHASEFQSVGSPITTLAIGEEGPLPTTRMLGEEGPPLTTLRLGEEDPTFRWGEGPLGTDVRVDDPAAISAGGGLTTLALGEEGGPVDPRLLGRGTPFGGF